MLEGLEVSEIKKSELERTVRIDAEFYSKFNIKVGNILSSLNSERITEFVNISDGNHMAISDHFSEDGIPYYRGGDIYNFFIEQTAKPLRIPKKVYNWPHMKRSHLNKGDVLISIVGAIIGNLSLVKTNQLATCSCKLAILRPKEIKPALIATFFKSKYGQSQIQKYRRGSGQTGLILADFDQLLMPNFSKLFTAKIEEIINQTFKKNSESTHIYNQAETVLLEIIGLNDFQLTREPINTKTFSSSFQTSGRLDAEYYLPKYEQIVNKIISQPHARLEDLTEIIKSVEPGTANYSDTGIPFVRVADYNKFGIEEPEVCIKNKYCEENAEKIKKLKLKKDTVLLSKDGSVGIAYTVKNDWEMLTSSAILHLKIKNEDELLPEYLALVLNSKITQMQAERDGGGSIILHWRMGDVKDVLIPVIDFEKQKEINDLVKESFKFKKQSKKLLETAKAAVEIAIEEDEEAAFSFIEEEAEGFIGA